MKKILLVPLILILVNVTYGQWKFTRSNTYPVIMYSHDTTIFTYDKGGRVWALCPHSDLRYYADTGIVPGQEDKRINAFAAIGNTIFAVGPSIYASTDNGRHWAITGNTSFYGVSGIVAIDTVLIFTWNHAIQRSTDYGKTWTKISDLSPSVYAFTNGILYAASGNQFYRSLDSGETWMKTADQGATYMVAVDRDIFVGSMQSTDAGETWMNHDTLDIWAGATDGTNVYAAGHARAVYASSDRGRTWLTVDANGLPGWFDASAICVFDSFVYVGGYDPVTREGTGLYYRPISEILPKSAVRSPHTIPVAERLDVYPNPFGTSCTARFTLDAPSDVRVSLFDATGREVRTVFGGTLQPGLNTLPIDGTGLADGVYWCRLAANGAERVAKLSLIRR
jgi:hypothetical protein